jgi:hypothetical protein
MKYLLNSAVITSPGTYNYRHITLEEARVWLDKGGWESTIGYPETAEALQNITGIPIPVNRNTITMQDGDEALVFRLVFPKGFRPDPAQKGAMGQDFILKNSEIGILRNVTGDTADSNQGAWWGGADA